MPGFQASGWGIASSVSIKPLTRWAMVDGLQCRGLDAVEGAVVLDSPLIPTGIIVDAAEYLVKMIERFYNRYLLK